MDFFEKLGKKATETFNTAAEKTNKIATDTKLKLKINDCKGKIDDIYKEIGKKVYERFVLDGTIEIKEEISEQLSKISEITDQIEEYERQRMELADLKQCENCKNKIDRSSKYCPECGEKQPEEEIHEAEIVEDESIETETDNEIREEASEEVNEIVEEVRENEDNNEEN